MGKWPLTIVLATSAALGLAGCAGSPWSCRGGSETRPASPAVDVQKTAATTPTASTSSPDPQAMQQVIAELQQVGALDPAGQDKLMADLRQTDPSLWPLMLQQFRAAAAYRRQLQQRETPGDLQPQQLFRSGPPLPGQAAPGVETADGIADSGPPAARPTARPLPRKTDPSAAVARLPVADDAALPPAGAPQGAYPDTAQPPVNLHAAQRPPQPTATLPPGGIVRASFDQPAPNPEAQLVAAIRALESQSKGQPKSDAEIAQQARLRMLYMLAGRRDDALRPIASAPPATQDFWAKQVYAMSNWLDTDRNPDTTRRAAETKRAMEEAASRLGETAPLVVRNLTFCKAVHSYGALTLFAKNEFAPEQEVVLYAEVENFSSEPTAKGHHTSLRSSYHVLDARGQRVAEPETTTTDDYCQNPRRDFFICYRLYLPKRMYPGKHTLQLTIEDLKSRKVGQSAIEFRVKGG